MISYGGLGPLLVSVCFVSFIYIFRPILNSMVPKSGSVWSLVQVLMTLIQLISFILHVQMHPWCSSHGLLIKSISLKEKSIKLGQLLSKFYFQDWFSLDGL